MWKIVLIPVISILVWCAWQFFNWVWLKPKKIERLFRKQGMRGSSYKFLFGDSEETELLYKESYSKPIGLYDDILPRIMPDILNTVTKYGNYSFMWSGPRPRVFLLEPDVIRQVLSKYNDYHKSFKIVNPIAKMLVTGGLAGKEGEEWSKSRAKLNPSFHLDKIKPMVPAIQLCCENIIKEWEAMIPKGEKSCIVDVVTYNEIFTSSVLAQLMFSSTYTEKIKETFFKLLELEGLGKLATRTFSLPGEEYFPTEKNRKAKEIYKFVQVSFTSMINERLQKRETRADADYRDLLDIFMEELYEEKHRNERDRRRIIEGVVGQLKIFFFAGFGTTSNLLTWTLLTLSAHQDWQDRAREEVLQVLGNKTEVTSIDTSNLKIVTMILYEMLRLYPAGMEFSRVVEEDTKLGEYMIPKDTLITCPILFLNRRSTEIWGKDAGEFNPQRFAKGVSKATKGGSAFMPFGWGPRICIAQNFALLEAKTFMAVVLRNFSFKLSPTYTHAPFVDFTIHPQYGAPIVLTKL